MNRFADKAALVTGAASGIGRAAATRLAAEGARVACVDINREGLDETVAAIGDAAFALPCDLADAAQIEATVAAAVERLGGLDALCNVAGILRADHSHELALEDWDRILRVNLTGTFLMCREALPHLRERKGAIVNTASTAALGGHPWMAAYGASKGGIISMTHVLACEYVKQGVRINAICPGGITTPLHGQFQMPDGGDPQLIMRIVPLAGYGTPEQAAAAIAFLASDDAGYVNGAVLPVDGGMLA